MTLDPGLGRGVAGALRSGLLVAAACAVVAAGCGTGPDEARLEEAAQRTEAKGTSRIELVAVESGGAGRQTRCAGAADYRAQRLRLVCDGAETYVRVGDVAYVRGAGLGIAGAENRWVRLPQDSDEGLDRISPFEMLAWLQSVSEREERLGQADVRGEAATVYRLTVACDEVDLTCAGETAPVEIAVGDDGLVRQLRVQEHDTELTLTFFDFGVAATIEPPPASQVVDVGSLRPAPCRGGGHPIDAERALAALRTVGFSVEQDDECVGGAVEALGGAYAAAGSGAAFVVCTLSADRRAASGISLTRGPIGAQLRLANLTCNVYGVSGGGPSAANVDRVRRAFDALARELRP
jgi:hypothetical protein